MDKYLFHADLSKTVTIVFLLLRVALIAFFLLMAVKNLGGNEQIVSDFTRWGYPKWFRLLTAGLQLTGAAFIVSPATSFYGAVILGFIMVGAIITHVRFDPLLATLSPAVFLAVITSIGVIFRPGGLR